MNDSGTTQCLLFEGLSGKRVEVQFSGQATSSDGGAVLLKGADRLLGLIKSMSASMSDRRDPTRVKHEMETLMSQRVFAVACGYEDGNDAARLSSDPVMKLISGRDPSGDDLASQPTISRLENAPRQPDLFRMGTAIIEAVVERHRRRLSGRAEKITIDLDQTVDEVHGQQQGSLFNGHYGSYCFIPLLGAMTFNDESEQIPIAAILRPGNSPDKRGAIGVLRRLLPLLRKGFPKAQIFVRLDAGFCAPEILEYLDSERLFYAVGYGKNPVLNRIAAPLMKQVRRASRESNKTEKRFTSTTYRARSWSKARTVVIKAEVTRIVGREPRDNPRYVVTNIPQGPQALYEEFYCQRGEFENRIKELKHGLKIDRTSCPKFQANQFRLLLTLAAYLLLQEVRFKARFTPLAKATVSRLRLELIKVGARVTSSVRRIFVELPSAYPFQRDWLRIVSALGAVLRPPVAQERVEQRPDGLVRITLKKAYADGTVAVDMDPLSLLCRLATSVPPPRFHTIHYAGVLAAASPWRSRLTPPLPPTAEDVEPEKRVRKSGYRPWAELLERTFAVDILTCPSCQGRMKLLAVVKNPVSIARYLAAAGELTDVPSRAPGRGPPYWKSRVLRLQALGDDSDGGDHGSKGDEAA